MPKEHRDGLRVLLAALEIEAVPLRPKRTVRRHEHARPAFVIGVCRDCGNRAIPGEFRCLRCE